MKKGSGQMKGVISFFFFSSLCVVYGRSREFFLPSTLYISPRVSKIAIEIPGIFFAEKNRGGGEAYLDSARAGREASNNSHRSLGRHSSTFLNSGCIRRMMRGVSSRDSPFSRRFSSPFSLPLSPEGLLLFPSDPCVAPVCEDAIILHSSYRRYLTRFLPSRVITKRFELTIEYFSNQPLDYSILIVPLRLENFNFNLLAPQLLVFGNN